MVANPAAGLGRGQKVAGEVAQAINRLGRKVELAFTDGPGKAEELVRTAAENGARSIIVCGGDGTIMEAARAVAGTGVRLVLAPGGRGNDLVQHLDLPPDPVGIAALAVGEGSIKMDLGLIGRHHFCTVAAFGFDAFASRLALDLKLPLGGQATYLYCVIKGLISYRPRQVRLTWEGGGYSGPVFMISTANTDSYGGRIMIAPMARCDDGLLDVCLVAPVSRLRALRLLPAVVKGRHVNEPEVTFIRTPWLTMETEEPMEIFADGDPVALTPQTLSVDRRALTVAA